MIDWANACPQSAQIVVVVGHSAATQTLVPIDAAGGNCRIVVPEIPNVTWTAPSTTATPTTEVSYDLTGMGAGPWQTLISAAPPAGRRRSLSMRCIHGLCIAVVAAALTLRVSASAYG